MLYRNTNVLRLLGVGVISLALTVYVKIVSEISLLKIAGSGDLLPAYSTSSSIFGCGSWKSQFGYPFGTFQYLRPSSDWLYSIPANLTTCMSGNPFLGLNLVWLMSFPLTFVLILIVLNHFKVAFPVAITIGLIGALIPFHWVRISHLYLSVTFPSVLILFLCIYLVKSRPQDSVANSGDIGNWPKWLISITGFSLAISGVYYAIFGLLLMMVAFLFSMKYNAWSNNSFKRVWVFTPVFLGLFLSRLISFQANRLSPGDTEANERTINDTVLYSGNLSRILLPSPSSGVSLPDWIQTRIVNLEGLAQGFNLPVPFESGSYQNIPTVILIIFTIVILLITNGTPTPDLRRDKNLQSNATEIKMLWLVLLVSIAFFVPWGFNIIFAEFVSPQIRAWGRLEPIIVITFLVLSSIYISRFFKLFEQYKRIQLISMAVLTLILFVDVTPMLKASTKSNVDSIKVDYDSARKFGEVINSIDSTDCGVLQIPYVPWPETGAVYGLPSDGHLLMSLANPKKNWSFGAFESSPTDILTRNIGNDITDSEVDLLVRNGFCGVQMDLRAFESAEAYVPVVNQYSIDLDTNPVISENGYWMYWSLPE